MKSIKLLQYNSFKKFIPKEETDDIKEYKFLWEKKVKETKKKIEQENFMCDNEMQNEDINNEIFLIYVETINAFYEE